MGILFRPMCWATGHNWSNWYRLGHYWRRECDWCDAVEKESVE